MAGHAYYAHHSGLSFLAVRHLEFHTSLGSLKNTKESTLE